MRSYSSLLLTAFLGYVTVTAAPRERQIVQVQYAGFDPVAKHYYVKEITKPVILIGQNTLPRIAVEFSPDSDRAALSSFEKVVTHWILNPATISSKISCDVRLRMTLVVDTTTDSSIQGDELRHVTLRDWKLELPFRVTLRNPTDADIFSAEYLVDSPKIILGESLLSKIPSRHFTTDPEKVKSFDAECAKGSPYGLYLKTHLTAESLQLLLKESSSVSLAAPTKLQKQFEELYVLIGKLESKDGGCVVSPLIDMGGQWGFGISPPSLAAAGGPTCDHVIQVFLTRAVTHDEWQQAKSEFNKLKQEQEGLLPRYRSLRKTSAPPSADDAKFILHFKQLGLRMIAIDNPIDGLPMAGFNNIGLIIIPSFARPSDAPAISEKSLQAMATFYRQLATVVKFHDIEEVLTLLRPTSEAKKSN